MISLILEHKGNIEQRVFSQSEVLIGRGGTDSKVDLDLSHDPTVSRLHLRVLERDKMLFVEDLGSTTGTFINDTRIYTIQQIFESDTILIGENIIRIRFDGGAASTIYRAYTERRIVTKQNQSEETDESEKGH